MQNAKLRYGRFVGRSEAKLRVLNECPVDIQIPKCIPEGYIAK